MNTRKKYALIGFVFTLILGTLWHFVYEWSNENFLIGLISPVDESVREHMKLLFFPGLLYALFLLTQKTFVRLYPASVYALLGGIIIGSWIIPICFYIYVGILHSHYLVLDILIFILAVAIAFFCMYQFSDKKYIYKYRTYIALLTILMLISFCLLTLPHLTFSVL